MSRANRQEEQKDSSNKFFNRRVISNNRIKYQSAER